MTVIGWGKLFDGYVYENGRYKEHYSYEVCLSIYKNLRSGVMELIKSEILK